MKAPVIKVEISTLRQQIDAEIIHVIAKASILNLMVDGIAKDNEQAGMALEEIGDQLDKAARSLLEAWESLSQHLDDTHDDVEVSSCLTGRGKGTPLHG